MTILPEINGCEVCGAQNLRDVLDLGKHPMCDDLVPVGDDRRCREYPIRIAYCDACHTAHQRHQIPKQELFPRSYHYRSRFTADVLNGMRTLVEEVFAAHSLGAAPLVLDVGCNDGSLLDFFRERGARTIGVEPTGASAEAQAKGHAVYDTFFAPDLAARIRAEHADGVDVITFTNVFAHIEDLGSVLNGIEALVHERTVLVVENHYLGSVLNGCQFDTFYHEHPRTYSLSSFAKIADRLGMKVVDCMFPKRYGGNIRVSMSRSGSPAPINDLIRGRGESGFGDRLVAMSDQIRRWKGRKLAELAGLVARHGPLRAKAFPGRAAILIKLLGIDVETIGAVHEKPGSIKIGHFVPGTRIPIVSDDELPTGSDAPPVLVNLAWHISDEIRGYLAKTGFSGRVVDILSPSDLID